MSGFNAFRVFEESGKISGRVTSMSIDDLTPGDVVIKAAFSSVNYKDALAGTGAGKIMRRFPLVGGIDVAGTIESSTNPRWTKGTPVLVTGYDLGVNQDGGFAEYVRVPSDWVVAIPDGLTALDAMIIGTAGFTAALSVVEMERNGLKKDAGPVIVTGATGGVGSVAVEILSGLGYSVTALTGKDDQHEFLRSIGAADVLSRSTLADGYQASREVAVGGSGRSGWRRDARLADPDDELRGTDRQLGLDRRNGAQNHRASVHPARCEAAGDRFGNVPDAHPSRGLDQACDRHEATQAERTSTRDRSFRPFWRFSRFTSWKGRRPDGRPSRPLAGARRGGTLPRRLALDKAPLTNYRSAIGVYSPIGLKSPGTR